MPLYEKKDRNGNWQRKQLYFHTIDAIIWKKRQKRELAEETISFQCNQFHNKLNVLLYDIPRPSASYLDIFDWRFLLISILLTHGFIMNWLISIHSLPHRGFWVCLHARISCAFNHRYFDIHLDQCLGLSHILLHMFVFVCPMIAKSQCWSFALKYPYLSQNSASGICAVVSKFICQSIRKDGA